MEQYSRSAANEYSQISFIKYFGRLVRKHCFLILTIALLFGGVFYAHSLIQTFTSTTSFHFREASVDLDETFGPQGKTQISGSKRDENFAYVQTMPFFTSLAQRLMAHPKGEEIYPVFLKSKKNNLVKIKNLLYDSKSVLKDKDTVILVAESLKGILNFKKEHENGLVMLVKTGIPDFSLNLASVLAPLVKDVFVTNQSTELKMSLDHLSMQLEESNNNLSRLSEIELKNRENRQASLSAGQGRRAILDIEKELRFAQAELQQFEFMVKNLEKELSKTNRYPIEDTQYQFIDHAGQERLEELKRKKISASAKVKSITNIYEKMKLNDLELPASEQIEENITWKLNLERAINKDLVIRKRTIESKLKSIENVVSVMGQVTLLSTSLKIAKPVKFFLGFLLGIFLSLVGIYYFYDFFNVIKDQQDFSSIAAGSILSVLPHIKKSSKVFDLSESLPSNHHILQSFRFLMKYALEQKVVSFLGSRKGEGKSFLIANVAQSLAKFGKKILIVDTNYKNPTITRHLRSQEGITVLSAEIFRHDKYSALDRSLLIREIRTHSKDCDVVLIDTINLYESNDALVAASVSNASIMMLAYLETFNHRLETALKKIELAELSNVSFVLNKASFKDVMIKTQTSALEEVDIEDSYLREIG